MSPGPRSRVPHEPHLGGPQRANARGARLLNDEYGKFDQMTPRSGIMSNSGLSVAIYLTKPASKEWHNQQEIHLLRCVPPPQDIANVYHGRVGSQGGWS